MTACIERLMPEKALADKRMAFVYALQGNGIDRADTAGCNGCGWREDEMYTLNTIDRPAVAFAWANSAKAGLSDDETAPTLKAANCGEPAICYPETARMLAARYDTSPCVDRGQNVVALDCRNFTGNNEVSATLQAKSNGGHSLNYVNPVVYDARGNGDGVTAPTLTGDHERRVTDYTAVCVGNGQMCNITMQPIANTLDCMHDQQAVVYPGVGITSPENRSNPQPGDPSCALTNDSRNCLVQEAKPPRKYIVRRLTPTECARLQGFPDEWCEGLGGSDSAIYKAYGNGLALPCAYDVMNRIARFVEHEKEE